MSFFVIAMFASILYGKICVDNSTMGDFVRLPKSSTVSSVLMYIALVGIILCAAGFLLNIIGTSSVVMFLKMTNGLGTHEAFFAKARPFYHNFVTLLQGQLCDICAAWSCRTQN